MPLVPATTPRLGLTRPAGTDAFTRQMFVDAFDDLDTFPGVFVCTSTARPSWGAAQAGMLIQETDTGRIMRWTGTAWTIVEQYTRAYRITNGVNDTLSHGASPSAYSLGTVTLTRTATLNVLMSARIQKAASSAQQITLDPWIDNTTCGFGFDEGIYFPDGVTGTTNSYQISVPVYGARASLAPGAHTISCKVTVGNTSTATINLKGLKAFVFLSE